MPPSEDETKVDPAQLAPVEPIWPAEPIWSDNPPPPRQDLASRLLAEAPELAAYSVERELARGGQGAVFLARHRATRAPVAVKLLLDAREKDPFIRFVREATLLQKLQHPHLPRVLAYGPCASGAFIVMEYVAGRDLKTLVETEGIPAFSWTARTLAVMANALDYAHGLGVVHRDVKPQNIVLEREERPASLDRGGIYQPERPVLVDFGLAKRVPGGVSPWTTWDPLTATGALLGTPAFMAPEQASGDAVGPAADVYGLGATLYYLLTGRVPHEGESNVARVYAAVKGTFPRPRQINPEVPPELDAVCMKAMALMPEERYRTAEELRFSLGR